MEDSYINNTSLNTTRQLNTTYNGCIVYNSKIPSFYIDYLFKNAIMYVVQCIVICLGFPLTLAAIYGIYSLVKNDHVAPIFIINLLISDLIQLCCLTVQVAKSDKDMKIPIFTLINDMIYFFGLTTSICFMMCIALERYLVIAWPLWYRFRRTIKTSVVVSVVVWIFALVCNLVVRFSFSEYMETIYAVFLLLPLPLFIFFLFGTIKALSAAISVPPDEKRRIVAILVLVLLIYTLLFLPTIIMVLVNWFNSDLWYLSFIFIKISPLADLFLYVLLRKGTTDKFLASVCCCRMNSDSDTSGPTA